MGTRAVYTFNDGDEKFHIYKHWDGYPEGSAIFFMNAIAYAWGGKRFEAGDFAAAFIAGNKKEGGGDVYFTKGPNRQGDLEYIYELSQNSLGGLMIKAYSLNWNEEKRVMVKSKKPMFNGSLFAFISNYGDEETRKRAEEQWLTKEKQAA